MRVRWSAAAASAVLDLRWDQDLALARWLYLTEGYTL